MYAMVGSGTVARKKSRLTESPRASGTWSKHERSMLAKRRARIVQEYLYMTEKIPNSTQKDMVAFIEKIVSVKQWGNITNPLYPAANLSLPVATAIALHAEEITLDWLLLGKERNLDGTVLRRLNQAEYVLIENGVLPPR
jgi:hypothetical protein